MKEKGQTVWFTNMSRLLTRLARPGDEGGTTDERMVAGTPPWSVSVGFFGAAGRFLLSGWIGAHSGQFPYGTLAVNVIGSLAIGFLVAGLAERVLAGAAVRLLVMAGFLGAFTTFSAFSYESVQLWNQGRWPALARQHRLERRRLPAGHLHRNGCGARPDPGPALVPARVIRTNEGPDSPGSQGA